MSDDADPIAVARERFVSDTARHVMDVVLDEDLHRHLRFRDPSTSTFWFDLVTWPGHLAIVGDCGSFVFARTSDMFEFFGASGGRGDFEDARWGINPHYWSEKLRAPSPAAALTYSPKAFGTRVLAWFNEVAEELTPDEASSLREALNEHLLSNQDAHYSEHEAMRLLQDFEHEGRRIYDAWEWSLREYDWSFLWCCWAIVWGIGQYRALKTLPEPAAAVA